MTRRVVYGLSCVVLSAAAATVGIAARSPKAAAPLRVCADPNNLPFSDSSRAGFENHIAALIGSELHRPLEYQWWAQRRGFVRSTLNAGSCDLVIGTAAGMEMLATTRPYYTSTYVFVTRRDRGIAVRSLNDSILRRVRVGVQLIGDDFANTPPAHALAKRGIVRNVVGFPVYGDYAHANPGARIVNAVAADDVDVAIVWGPIAGYFAARSPVPLELTPVTPKIDLPYLPFVFDIAMGVRRGDSAFRKELDAVIARRTSSIDSILGAYDVPLIHVRGPAGVQ
jgi:quinoprotein dehydrogenase-associated probable ABC transporter substrate-binding protein